MKTETWTNYLETLQNNNIWYNVKPKSFNGTVSMFITYFTFKSDFSFDCNLLDCISAVHHLFTFVFFVFKCVCLSWFSVCLAAFNSIVCYIEMHFDWMINQNWSQFTWKQHGEKMAPHISDSVATFFPAITTKKWYLCFTVKCQRLSKGSSPE